MGNNNDLALRLRLIIDHYDMNVNELSEKIGGTNVKYYNLINGKSKPDYKTTNSILEAFPEISAEWFMRGNGDMIIKEKKDLSDELAKVKAELARERAIVGKLVGKHKSTKSPLAREKDNRIHAAKKANAKMRGFNKPSKPLVFRAPKTPLIFRFSDN